MKYSFFKVSIANNIAQVVFNRPEKANALHAPAWDEMKSIFEDLDDNPEARVIVLTAEGRHFCAGIDLAMLMNLNQFSGISCEGRKKESLRKTILHLQDCISAIEKCRKPVLAAIHKACVGGGVDIVSACDMRYCTEDAYFSIKEVDMGLVADIGTLQRLPHVLNRAMVAELAFTARRMYGPEAEKVGLVNRMYSSREDMLADVMKLAATIAAKSPLVIRGTKQILLYQRDHSIKDSLDYVATWNAAMLLSNDLMEAFQASVQKREAVFEN